MIAASAGSAFIGAGIASPLRRFLRASSSVRTVIAVPLGG